MKKLLLAIAITSAAVATSFAQEVHRTTTQTTTRSYGTNTHADVQQRDDRDNRNIHRADVRTTTTVHRRSRYRRPVYRHTVRRRVRHTEVRTDNV